MLKINRILLIIYVVFISLYRNDKSYNTKLYKKGNSFVKFENSFK